MSREVVDGPDVYDSYRRLTGSSDNADGLTTGISVAQLLTKPNKEAMRRIRERQSAQAATSGNRRRAAPSRRLGRLVWPDQDPRWGLTSSPDRDAILNLDGLDPGRLAARVVDVHPQCDVRFFLKR